MVAYARGLQYWVKKFNLLESPDLCPLAGSIVELRETLWEHVTFTNWDVLQGLGQSTLELQASDPKPPCLAGYCHHWSRDRILWKPPPTPLPPLLMRMKLDVPPHHLEQKEKTGTWWSLLPLWSSSAWGLVAIVPKSPQLTYLRETHSKTHRWLPCSLGHPGQSVMEVPPWRSWRSEMDNRPHLRSNQITAFG